MDILLCNLAKFCFASWACLMRISNGVHNHVGVNACAITIDFIRELVVYEEENHEIGGHANAIWMV